MGIPGGGLWAAVARSCFARASCDAFFRPRASAYEHAVRGRPARCRHFIITSPCSCMRHRCASSAQAAGAARTICMGRRRLSPAPPLLLLPPVLAACAARNVCMARRRVATPPPLLAIRCGGPPAFSFSPRYAAGAGWQPVGFPVWCAASVFPPALWWILSSKPTGFIPVGKPSTECGAEQRRIITDAWITGRGAHQNDKSNASATLIHSKTPDYPKTYTHIPSEEKRRTSTMLTPGRHNGGTGTHRATISGAGLKWPLPSILDHPSTGGGPPPVSGGCRKVTKNS